MTPMNRAVGAVLDIRRLGDHDHVCWSFEDRADFVEGALAFLDEGLRRRLQVAYVGARPVPELAAELAPLGDVAGLVAGGSVVIDSLPAMYPSGSVIDPDHQVDEYRRATRAALSAGFKGFRVAAEATAMVETPAQRDAFTRYEHRVDLMMATEPFSALCGYDTGVLGDAGVAELACLHPVDGGHASPFHFFARDRERLALAGEFDLAGHDLFRWALSRTAGLDDTLHIDIGDVDFIDHRALVLLDTWAAQQSGAVVLERATPTVRRLASVLGLERLRVTVAA